MDGPYGPIIDGWGWLWQWLWQMQLTWMLLGLLVLALVVFSLVTTRHEPTAPTAPKA